MTKIEAIRRWTEGATIKVHDPIGDYDDGVYYMNTKGELVDEGGNIYSIDAFHIKEIYTEIKETDSIEKPE